VKFTTLIPTTSNEGSPFSPSPLARLVNVLWRPFSGMTNEGLVSGRWIDEEGTEYSDVCIKISIECERSRIGHAIRAVKRIGRKLKQKAMYFEVSGYDGVQILAIE
jgi:hypothetical protein